MSGPRPDACRCGWAGGPTTCTWARACLIRRAPFAAREALSSKGLLITNETVGSLYGGLVQRSLSLAGLRVPRVDIPDGEQYKTLETAQRVYRAAVGHRLDRRSFFIALGGGVVGDLAGFAAATFLRGVALIQVPTTLLAQVDAAVGGKVGVNLDEGKNLVGAFHQPRIVIADVDTLRTLPKRQLAAGLAEVIKYGVIGDPDLLQFVEDRLDRLAAGDRAALLRIVARSCEIKAAVVAEDERETEGVRECLNFGHTIGHALEAAFGYEGMLHGEAVAAGMVAAAMLSARLTGFPEPRCSAWRICSNGRACRRPRRRWKKRSC